MHNRLNLKTNAVYQKIDEHALFELRSFDMCSKMMEIFSHSVVVSAVGIAVFCWGSSITAGDANRLN